MNCRHCGRFCEPTFEGLQRWCRGCGRLYWMNPDDTVRGVHVPEFLTARSRNSEGELAEVTASNDPAGANVEC